MFFNYLLADFSSCLNSAILSRRLYMDIKLTNLTLKVLEILRNTGSIKNYMVRPSGKVRVYFRFINNKPVLKRLKLISKPSKRIYWKLNKFYYNSVHKTIGGYYIISTSSGLYTTSELLLMKNLISGEVLLFVEL